MFKSAVVIPTYKEELNELEKISLAQVRKVLKNYPIIFVGPEGKNFSYLEPGEMLIQFHQQYFQSVKTYSQLLLQPFFYEPFLVFDYILIYQLDAFVFYDALEDFCRLGYDYIGAVWPRYSWSYTKIGGKTPLVGNGGFSLRNPKACHNLLKRAATFPGYKDVLEEIHGEDAFFAMCGLLKDTDFHVAPIEVADCFSMEWYPDRHVKKLRGDLPFGCHNWTKFSANFYVELFGQFGYDLRPLRDQMKTDDYEFYLPRSFARLAVYRLIRDLDRKKSPVQFLPTKKFASIRLNKSPKSMEMLARLLVEENSLADKIFIFEEKDFFDLLDWISEVEKENLPHLIFVVDYNDELLIEAIEKKGLTYGEHFISFQCEYLKFQEKLFHNLGR